MSDQDNIFATFEKTYSPFVIQSLAACRRNLADKVSTDDIKEICMQASAIIRMIAGGDPALEYLVVGMLFGEVHYRFRSFCVSRDGEAMVSKIEMNINCQPQEN